MEAKSYLGGRAIIKSLPATEHPAKRAEVCARLRSSRGELAVLTDGSVAIRHLSYVELRPEMVRGNHYHKLRREFFYIVSGELTVQLQDMTNKEAVTVKMRTGDMATIEPGIAHAMKPLDAGHAIEFAAEPFDAADVYPHPLL